MHDTGRWVRPTRSKFFPIHFCISKTIREKHYEHGLPLSMQTALSHARGADPPHKKLGELNVVLLPLSRQGPLSLPLMLSALSNSCRAAWRRRLLRRHTHRPSRPASTADRWREQRLEKELNRDGTMMHARALKMADRWGPGISSQYRLPECEARAALTNRSRLKQHLGLHGATLALPCAALFMPPVAAR